MLSSTVSGFQADNAPRCLRRSLLVPSLLFTLRVNACRLPSSGGNCVGELGSCWLNRPRTEPGFVQTIFSSYREFLVDAFPGAHSLPSQPTSLTKEGALGRVRSNHFVRRFRRRNENRQSKRNHFISVKNHSSIQL